MEKFAIIVPVYNEEYNIIKLADELEKLEIPFIFVDDGSTDKTATNLWMKDLPALIYFPNRGKGYALRLGSRYFIKEGFEWILTMDSDGQHSIEDIEKFDNALLFDEDKYTIFIGNRLWDKKSMPKIRYWINKFMSWVLSKIAGQEIEDSQCGFRMIHKGVFEQCDLKEDGFAMESELLVKASRLGCKIKNIPIKCIYYKNRKSNIKIIKDCIKFIRLLWRLRRNKF